MHVWFFILKFLGTIMEERITPGSGALRVQSEFLLYGWFCCCYYEFRTMHVWFQLYQKYYIADCPFFPQSYSSCSVFMIAFFEHPCFWNFGSFYYLIYACSVSIIELFLAMEEKKRTDPLLVAPT